LLLNRIEYILAIIYRTEDLKWEKRDWRTGEVCCEITEENERVTLVFPLDSYVVFNVFFSHMVFYLLVFRLCRVYYLTLTCALYFSTLIIFGVDYKLRSALLCRAVCLPICLSAMCCVRMKLCPQSRRETKCHKY